MLRRNSFSSILAFDLTAGGGKAVSIVRASLVGSFRAVVLILAGIALVAGAQVVSTTNKTSASGVQLSSVGGSFVDATDELGIRFYQQGSPTSRKYLLETMGSGVALFDYDNDGRLDIYFANGARLDDPTRRGTIPKKDDPKYWNRLYRQRPDGRFEDVTEKTGVAGFGYSTGVAVGDYDNDGFEDLYVAGYGNGTLYHNNGDGTFTDVTATTGVAGSGWMTSVAWVDYDNDGRLDLVIARYMHWDFNDIYCGRREGGVAHIVIPTSSSPSPHCCITMMARASLLRWQARQASTRAARDSDCPLRTMIAMA